MSILASLRAILRATSVNGGNVSLSVGTEAKLKHLELIGAAITRMANNSFLFKGWSITLATALSGFAAVNTKSALLTIAIISTVLFWGLDAYYLWLERGFVNLHKKVAKLANDKIDFDMAVDKKHAFWRWLKTCFRWHLLFFYGVIVTVEVIGIFVIKGSS